MSTAIASQPTEESIGQSQNTSAGGLWARLKERLEFANYCPEVIPDVEESILEGREGSYCIIKNPRDKTYYRLDAHDYYLWSQMDGTRTVRELVVSYFMHCGVFSFARIGSLVQDLKKLGFLADRAVNVYQQVDQHLARRHPTHRINQLAKAYLNTTISISSVDRLIGAVYRGGAWILYTKLMLWLTVVIIIVGLLLFTRAFISGGVDLMTVGVSPGILGVILTGLILFAVLCHEMAHGLTVKHYGRDVRRGGFMLYFGMPAFFVDTTDIWMEGKRARLAVTWGGPHGSLIVAGIAAMIMTISPWPVVNGLLYILAFITYVQTFFNLNPLLELDGYFLLMDWLEIPMLRARSVGFIRSGLWSKVKGAAGDSGSWLRTLATRGFWSGLTREEYLFTIFGILSATWTVIAIILSFGYWQSQIGSVTRLWYEGSTGTRILLGLAGIVIGVAALWLAKRLMQPQVRKLRNWINRQPFFASTWHLTFVLWAASLLIALATFFSYQPAMVYVVALSLVVAAYYAWTNAKNYDGSRLQQIFVVLLVFAILSLMGTLLTTAGQWNAMALEAVALVVTQLQVISSVAIFLASIMLMIRDDPTRQSRRIRWTMILGMFFAIAFTTIWRLAQPPDVPTDISQLAGILLPALAAALLIPTIVSSWDTAFAPSWFGLALAFLIVSVSNALLLPLQLAYLITATALFIGHLAYLRVGYQPQNRHVSPPSRDHVLLTRSFVWTFEGLYDQLQKVAGARRTQRVIEQYNALSSATNWMIEIKAGIPTSDLPANISLVERGRKYGAALSLFLNQMKPEIGQPLTVQALQRSYDALPWEDREIATHYLFNQIEQARFLSSQFQARYRDYTALLRQMPLFSTMTAEEIELLAARLKLEQLAAGKVFIRQGEQGDRFYIIRSGHVEVTQRDENGYSQVIDRWGRGDYVGEVALLRDSPRNATCRATVPTEVLSLSRNDFDQLVRAHFEMGEKVNLLARRAGLLRRIPIFAEFDGKKLQQLATKLVAESFDAGEFIIRQGALDNTLYIIEAGQVEVILNREGEEKIVNEFGPDAYFGEMALILKVPRTASVRTCKPTIVLALRQSDFKELVTNELDISRTLELETSRRLSYQRRSAPVAVS